MHISLGEMWSHWIAITHLPAILKTYVPTLLLTTLKTHQKIEKKEMFTLSVERPPFCSDFKQRVAKYSFTEKDLLSLIKLSTKESIFPPYSVFPVFYFSHFLDLLNFFLHKHQTNKLNRNVELEHTIRPH